MSYAQKVRPGLYFESPNGRLWRVDKFNRKRGRWLIHVGDLARVYVRRVDLLKWQQSNRRAYVRSLNWSPT